MSLYKAIGRLQRHGKQLLAMCAACLALSRNPQQAKPFSIVQHPEVGSRQHADVMSRQKHLHAKEHRSFDGISPVTFLRPEATTSPLLISANRADMLGPDCLVGAAQHSRDVAHVVLCCVPAPYQSSLPYQAQLQILECFSCYSGWIGFATLSSHLAEYPVLALSGSCSTVHLVDVSCTAATAGWQG